MIWRCDACHHVMSDMSVGLASPAASPDSCYESSHSLISLSARRMCTVCSGSGNQKQPVTFARSPATGQDRDGVQGGGLCPLCLLHWHEACGHQLASAVEASDAPQDLVEGLRNLRSLPHWVSGTLGCTAREQQQPLCPPSPRTVFSYGTGTVMQHE